MSLGCTSRSYLRKASKQPSMMPQHVRSQYFRGQRQVDLWASLVYRVAEQQEIHSGNPVSTKKTSPIKKKKKKRQGDSLAPKPLSGSPESQWLQPPLRSGTGCWVSDSELP